MFTYVFGETMFAFFVSFLFFFLVFFLNQLLLMAQEILAKRVPFYQVALLVVYSLPSIIALSTPFAALLGTLMTIGRLSSDNEMLVMLTSGMSYKNVFAPVFLIGVLVSLFSFGVNDVLLPLGTIHFTRLYRRIVVSTPALEIEANSVKKFKDTVMITGNVTKNSIDDMLILDKTNEGERRVIMAKHAEFVDDGVSGISLDMNDAFIHASKETERRDYDYAAADSLNYRIDTADIIQTTTTVSAREMSSKDVYKEIKVKEALINKNFSDRNNRTLETALSLEETLRAGPSGRNWNQKAGQLASFNRELTAAEAIRSDRTLLIFRLEFFKKFSMPSGALSLIFLALPIGLMAKKSGQTMGILFGISLSVLYWALLLVGQNMGIRLGYSPFWTMWLPNMLSISIGFVMCVRRVSK
jgi:lipopolysaccharide export system permease protein